MRRQSKRSDRKLDIPSKTIISIAIFEEDDSLMTDTDFNLVPFLVLKRTEQKNQKFASMAKNAVSVHNSILATNIK